MRRTRLASVPAERGVNYAGLLVGLGNPGTRYAGTRHNSGFAFVEALLRHAEQHGTVQESNGAKFSCHLWRITVPQANGVWLAAKPLTFMNLSGHCVQPLLIWHKIMPDQMVVAHDELDIPPGELRFKFGGGNAGHNGLNSITELLGTADFYRLRMGIGRPPHKGDVLNWVLGCANSEETARLNAALARALQTFFLFMDKGVRDAANFARRAVNDNKTGT